MRNWSRKRDRILGFCILSTAMSGWSCHSRSPISQTPVIQHHPEPPATRENPEVLAAYQVIATCPHWEEARPVERSEIMHHARELSTFDLDTIRQAYVKYISGHLEECAHGGRLYLFNRFLFRVPDWVSPKPWRSRPLPPQPSDTIFGMGYIGVPERNHRFSGIYPLSRDRHGRLVLAYAFEGSMGPPFDALREFDSFRKVFGARGKSDR